MTAPSSGSTRLAELAERWSSLQQRVAVAAEAAGRKPGELTVIAVTKTWPVSDVAHLLSLGIREIGENRAQELATKIAELAADPRADDGQPATRAPHWHFIGQLQRNKASVIGRNCQALHTLDRVNLVSPLAKAAGGAGRRLGVFLQLSLDGDPKRGGLAEGPLLELADDVSGAPDLQLLGLMAVPPLGSPPRPAFARLRLASERLQRSHPQAVMLSAGMSADLEDAVKEGATHLRVGTDLMGSRP